MVPPPPRVCAGAPIGAVPRATAATAASQSREVTVDIGFSFPLKLTPRPPGPTGRARKVQRTTAAPTGGIRTAANHARLGPVARPGSGHQAFEKGHNLELDQVVPGREEHQG